MCVTFLVKSSKLFIQVIISWRIEVSCLCDGVGARARMVPGASGNREQRAGVQRERDHKNLGPKPIWGEHLVKYVGCYVDETLIRKAGE